MFQIIFITNRLFEENQELLNLFAKFQTLKTKQSQLESMELAQHATMVMSTIDEAINSLDNIDYFIEYLHSIGKLHHKVPGFKKEYFWVSAFISSLLFIIFVISKFFQNYTYKNFLITTLHPSFFKKFQFHLPTSHLPTSHLPIPHLPISHILIPPFRLYLFSYSLILILLFTYSPFHLLCHHIFHRNDKMSIKF